MKSKCSFILKASLALVLALVMLFGTVTTSLAAVIEDDLADTGAEVEDIADTGRNVELAETGGTSTTLYYAITSTDVGSYTVKCNTNHKGNGDDWHSYDMTDTGRTQTISGTTYKVYTCTFTDTYGGLGCIQFQLYNGNTFVSEVQPFGKKDWHSPSDYNGKLWRKDGTSWETYSPDAIVPPLPTPSITIGGQGSSVTLPTGAPTTLSISNYSEFSAYDSVSTLKLYRSGDSSTAIATITSADTTINPSVTDTYYVKCEATTGNTSTYSDSSSNNVSVTAQNIIINYKDAETDNPTMTYDATASAAKDNHIVYKKVLSWKGSSTYKIKMNDGSDRFKTNSGGNITDNVPLSGTGYDTQASGGNWIVLKTNTSITSSERGNYTLYWDYTDKKLYVEYPHTVTFNSHGGSAVASQVISYGADADVPDNPTREGYIFEGWKTEENGNTAFTFTNITANATAHAKWTEVTAGIALTSVTNGVSGNTTGGHIEDGSGNTIYSLSGIGVGTKGTAVSVTSGAGYSFIGWTVEGDNASKVKLYTNSNCTTAYTAGGTDTTIYIKTDGSSGITTENAVVKAHFQSSTAHYITVYNNTMYDRQHWVVVSSPPQTVKVTNPAGVTKTYKYGPGTKAQRGEDTVSTTHNPSTAAAHIVNTNNASYYEGNKLEVHEGDKVELIYSALASSDIITGVFYNNTIRYTTEKETDNLFTNREYKGTKVVDGKTVGLGSDDDVDFDYHDDTTHAASEKGGYALYANQYYYNAELAEVIAEQNYTATVDQDKHTVTWTIGNQDYLNVDMELASKKAIHFSDTVNAAIHEVHTDNYYAVGEDVSPSTTETGSLSIKAAGNSTQTNTITKANIKFYYCNNMGEYINPVNGKVVSKANRVELKEGDATLSVEGSDADSISNSGATDSTNFYYIDGAMPATDVMVDLDLSIAYTLTMKSVVRSDTSSPAKTAFGQVADLHLGNQDYSKNDSCTTSTAVATASCDSGKNITLKADDITSGYMFVGWYPSNSDGTAPDYTKTPILGATASYKPTASTTIWAVGTKDLYINGAKELFNVSSDWQADGTGTSHGNLRMSFDPSLGTQGKYYYEISETVFAAASKTYATQDRGNQSNASNNTGFYKGNDGKYYWDSDSDDNHGNAFFQFLDTASGNDDSNKAVWSGIECFVTEAKDSDNKNKIKYGKIYSYNSGSSESTGKNLGQGFINFNETDYSGYSAPIRIYYDPAVSGTFTVEPTSVYPHIHVSNGYKGIDTNSPSEVQIKVNSGTAQGNNSNNSDYSSDGMKFNGAGWNPTYEGHVSDITVKARNATLTLSKTVTNTDYKVSNFLVYNMTKGTVKAHPATASGTTYTCNTIKTSDDDRLYIVPIVEYCGSDAKITINVDSTKLDYNKWGKLVSCYVWGSSDSDKTCGSYPGQLMVPSDDGGSWTATFKAPTTLTGILFANYVDSGNNNGYTFLSMSGVMGSVSNHASGEASGGYVNVYNHIYSGDSGEYSRTNCKVQTYDYREPIAYFKNRDTSAKNTTLTFALKDGNSNLLSRSHAQLKDVNILTMASTSNPATPYDWSALKWEYLTDSSGKYYSDLNGFKLPEKPTASFYIAAKGMVIYKDNSMTTVFKTGKEKDSVTGVSYNDYYGRVANEIDMSYAVQWYVYDASGNYITNVLSAGFADKTDQGTNSGNLKNAMTVVTQRLLDLGYAVEGRSVKICYDKPRYCYNDSSGGINNGNSFNVYRFTGQWYEDNEYRTAKVYAKVGIKTDNGIDVADASAAAYGSASVSVDSSKCSIAGYSGTDTEGDVDYGYTTAIDGDSGALTLTASSQNFVGWYHYVTTYDSSDIDDSSTTQELVFDTDDITFKPTYSKDVTYIAIYKAKVNYRYKYTGREGGIKYYNVPASTADDQDNMSAAEIANGNKVAIDNTHKDRAVANNPGPGAVSIFKKDITFNGTLDPLTMFSNEQEYVLTVDNSSKSDPNYTVTAKYRDSNGLIKDKAVSKQYNQVIDLTVENSGTALTNQWAGHNFIGWYEYDNSQYGNLLSTQANYGLVCTKTQTIIAVYSGDGSGKTGPVGNDTWEVFLDDFGPTYEKTSTTTGDVYCDAIVRVRKNNSNLTTIADDARVGMLIVDDNGTNKTINTLKLKNYAIALRASNGKSGNVTVDDTTLNVTNIFSTSVNKFGRVDLAAKYSYGSVTGQKYHIYAYYFKGGDATDTNNYVFSPTTAYATGTYS